MLPNLRKLTKEYKIVNMDNSNWNASKINNQKKINEKIFSEFYSYYYINYILSKPQTSYTDCCFKTIVSSSKSRLKELDQQKVSTSEIFKECLKATIHKVPSSLHQSKYLDRNFSFKSRTFSNLNYSTFFIALKGDRNVLFAQLQVINEK